MVLSDAAEEQEEEYIQSQFEQEAKKAHWRQALALKKTNFRPKDNIKELFPANTVSFEHI